MYYVYILLSERYQKTYTEITNDLKRRLIQHNHGYHTYTKKCCPWILIHTEECSDRQEARKREKYLKSAAGRKWIKRMLFDK